MEKNNNRFIRGVDHWSELAKCKEPGVEQDWFFPDDPNDKEASLMARAICGSCVVSFQCLNEAISANTKYGIWGGYNAEREIPRIRNKMQQLRPSERDAFVSEMIKKRAESTKLTLRRQKKRNDSPH